ncbi:CRISPR-associated endonuclease Cas2 [Frankia sp. Mgl5]|uniref:CRISPR-associated endonuclease Cas2 n=1 Tax=Frankia sp. Mgl5 TaxID=2933793 RepID=UPI0034D6B3FA
MLYGCGPRVQLSVFKCEVRDQHEMRELRGELRDRIDPLEDQVRIYPTDQRTFAERYILGARTVEERSDYRIIRRYPTPVYQDRYGDPGGSRFGSWLSQGASVQLNPYVDLQGRCWQDHPGCVRDVVLARYPQLRRSAQASPGVPSLTPARS